MICFPNAKINIGLRITSKRNDGFHDIESIFFPINLFDALEVLICKNQSSKIKIYYSGNVSLISNDLCIKAYKLLDSDFNLPSIKVFLHKKIPIGSGLGGGSSNAVSMLKILNQLFKLNLTQKQLLNYCTQLGSDCAFFLYNKPSFVSGLGDIINPNINFSLNKYQLLLVFPSKPLSTSDVFNSLDNKNIFIKENSHFSDIFCKILSDQLSINFWQNKLKNNLESSAFKFIPEIKSIKDELYKMGAIYSSMSGSGSTVYGIFPKNQTIKNYFNKKYFSYTCDLI